MVQNHFKGSGKRVTIWRKFFKNTKENYGLILRGKNGIMKCNIIVTVEENFVLKRITKINCQQNQKQFDSLQVNCNLSQMSDYRFLLDMAVYRLKGCILMK